MNTLDLDFDRGRTSWTLIVTLAVLSLSGCSDSPTAPADPGSPGMVVTITSSSVSVGDLVRLTFTPVNPCWNQDAEMEVQLSWDGARFARIDAPGVAIEEGGGGRILARGMDRDGFGSGMSLAFQALADGQTAGFVVDQVTLRCARGSMIDLRNPPLLAPTSP